MAKRKRSTGKRGTTYKKTPESCHTTKTAARKKAEAIRKKALMRKWYPKVEGKINATVCIQEERVKGRIFLLY